MKKVTYIDMKKLLKENLNRASCYYVGCTLYIRSFFLKQRPLFLYVISSIYPFITLIIPTSTQFDAFIQMRLLLTIGVYLIVVDSLGSVFSKMILSQEKTSYLLQFFDNRNSKTIKGAFLRAGWSAVFVGKTPMTATGRAAMIAGVLSGAVFLYNGHLHREHEASESARQRAYQTEEAARQRAHQTEEAARQRAYANYTYARDQYDKSYFKKGPKPVWPDEDEYKK